MVTMETAVAAIITFLLGMIAMFSLGTWLFFAALNNKTFREALKKSMAVREDRNEGPEITIKEHVN